MQAITRAKGLVFDKPEVTNKFGAMLSASAHFGAPSNLPSEAMDMANVLGPFKDQGQTESCVGHGITRGVDTRLRVLGQKPPYGSPFAVWTYGRMLTRSNKNDKLTNEGTFARAAFSGLSLFGLPTEAEAPLYKPDGEVIDELNQDLPPDVMQGATRWKINNVITIRTTDGSRIADVKNALAQKHPIPCAGNVDEAFEAYQGKGVITAPDPKHIVGGHMMCIVAYRTNASGRTEFLVVNSWQNWGLPGSLCWVDEEWIVALYELYAFTLTYGQTSTVKKEPETEPEMADEKADEKTEDDQ